MNKQCKYPNWTRGQDEALLNHLGGEQMALLINQGASVIVGGPFGVWCRSKDDKFDYVIVDPYQEGSFVGSLPTLLGVYCRAYAFGLEVCEDSDIAKLKLQDQLPGEAMRYSVLFIMGVKWHYLSVIELYRGVDCSILSRESGGTGSGDVVHSGSLFIFRRRRK